jgi:predicted amidohydrolase
MIDLIEKVIPLRLPTEERISMLLAQIPSRLRYRNYFYQLVDPAAQWATVEQILRMVARGEDGLDQATFVVFPEVSVPFQHKDDLLTIIEKDFRPNTVTIAGFEHISLRQFWQLLAEYDAHNPEAHRLVRSEMNRAEADRPVNWCLIAVKDDEGQVRCFLEAKTHPFFGEEFLDQPRDLYRGQYIYFFRSRLAPLSFVVLICLDYIYRDRHGSNILTIIRQANEIYYRERQPLDLLFVIQCNPKPEHQVFRDTAVGFYGEYLIFTPGVKNATTVLLNTSSETRIDGVGEEKGGFGHSAVLVHKGRRLPATSVAEYSTDQPGGGPVSRLRFGAETRLYHLDLSLFHERDPRTSRSPLKILSVHGMRGGRWHKLEGDEIISGVSTREELD